MEIPQYPLHHCITQQTQQQELGDQFYSIDQGNSACLSHQYYQLTAKQTSYQYNFTPILTDTIQKKTLNLTWQQRYFCLTPTRLLYFTSKQINELKGCFNLVSLKQYNLYMIGHYPQICLVIEINSKEQKQIKILLRLNFKKEEIYKKWKITLNQILSNLINKQQFYPKINYNLKIDNNSLIGKKYNFWNKIIISSKQLLKYSNHLDIVYFRSKGACASLNRLIMRSYYDHVGLLVKNQFNQLYLFQAIQSRGVWVVQWNNVINNLLQIYQQIGYRKLIISKQQKISTQILQNYLNTLLGKKYQLSLSKLFSGQQLDNKIIQNKCKNQVTFFCSQLIADIYLKFGLLKSGKKNQYWPKDFQQDIKLQKGAILGPMMSIDLSSIQQQKCN